MDPGSELDTSLDPFLDGADVDSSPPKIPRFHRSSDQWRFAGEAPKEQENRISNPEKEDQSNAARLGHDAEQHVATTPVPGMHDATNGATATAGPAERETSPASDTQAVHSDSLAPSLARPPRPAFRPVPEQLQPEPESIVPQGLADQTVPSQPLYPELPLASPGFSLDVSFADHLSGFPAVTRPFSSHEFADFSVFSPQGLGFGLGDYTVEDPSEVAQAPAPGSTQPIEASWTLAQAAEQVIAQHPASEIENTQASQNSTNAEDSAGSLNQTPSLHVDDDKSIVASPESKSPVVGSSAAKPLEIIDLDSDQTSEPDSVEDQDQDVNPMPDTYDNVSTASGYDGSSGIELVQEVDDVNEAEQVVEDRGTSVPPDFYTKANDRLPDDSTGRGRGEAEDHSDPAEVPERKNEHATLQKGNSIHEPGHQLTVSSPPEQNDRRSVPLTPKTSGLQAQGPENPLSQTKTLPETNGQGSPERVHHKVQLETPLATQEQSDQPITSSTSLEATPSRKRAGTKAEKESAEAEEQASSTNDKQSEAEIVHLRTQDRALEQNNSISVASSADREDLSTTNIEKESTHEGGPQETVPHTEALMTPPPSLPEPSTQPTAVPAAEAIGQTQSAPQTEEAQARSPDPQPAAVPPRGIRTATAYYVPLSTIDEYFKQTIDVLAVVAHATAPERAPRGRRDFHQTLSLLDPSLHDRRPEAPDMVSAQVFRPVRKTLPLPPEGAVLLLRDFKTVILGGKMGLTSTDSSAWAVFKGPGEEAVMGGPPVEFGEEEESVAQDLRDWWEALDKRMKEKMAARVAEKSKRASTPAVAAESSGDKGVDTSGAASTDRRPAHSPSGDQSSDHELRNGTVYTDRPSYHRSEQSLRTHQLRDGRTYRDP